MTEGTSIETGPPPFAPLLLVPDEVEALDWLLDLLDVEWASSGTPQNGSQRDVLRKAVERAAPGSMQTHPGQPVHAARAHQTSPHGTAVPICDVAALGVVTNDRTLVDCEACLALIRGSQPGCPNGECDQGMVERLATPEEVDAGCELGVAFDPCPACNPNGEGTTSLMQRLAREAADAGVIVGPYGDEPWPLDARVVTAEHVRAALVGEVDAMRAVGLTSTSVATMIAAYSPGMSEADKIRARRDVIADLLPSLAVTATAIADDLLTTT